MTKNTKGREHYGQDAGRPAHNGPTPDFRYAYDEVDAYYALKHIKSKARREKESNRKRPPVTLAKVNF